MTNEMPDWMMDVPFRIEHMADDYTDTGIYRVMLLAPGGSGGVGMGDTLKDAAEAARSMMQSRQNAREQRRRPHLYIAA